MDNAGWLDIPGCYHGGASDFSFADGHCAIHKWESSQTRIAVNYSTERHWHPVDPAGLEDVAWLRAHASVDSQ